MNGDGVPDDGWDVYLNLYARVEREMRRVLAVADDLRRHEGELPGTPDSLHRLAKILDAVAAECGIYRGDSQPRLPRD